MMRIMRTARLDNRCLNHENVVSDALNFLEGGSNRNAVSRASADCLCQRPALQSVQGICFCQPRRARVSAKHGLACVGRAAQTKPSGSVEAKQLERGGTAPRAVDSLTENERLWFDSFPIQRYRPTLQNGTAELTLTGMGIAFPNAQPHSAAVD